MFQNSWHSQQPGLLTPAPAPLAKPAAHSTTDLRHTGGRRPSLIRDLVETQLLGGLLREEPFCWEAAGLLGSRDCRAQPDKLEAVSQSAALNIACSHTVAGIELVSPEPAHMLISRTAQCLVGEGGRRQASPAPTCSLGSQIIHTGLHFLSLLLLSRGRVVFG